MNLNEATILLTGAAGGIASAIASELGRAGASLLLTDLNGEALESVRTNAELRTGRVKAFAADITDAADRARLVDAARVARVNVLINAAGLNPLGPVGEQSAAQIELALRVNLLAPILLTQAMLPVLGASGQARILNIGSSFGAIGFPCFSTYSATKFGIRGFSEALRRELAATQIRVHYVAPRATDTRLVTDRIRAMNKALGIGMDSPETVARAVVDVLVRERREFSLGVPERIYARLNGLLPGVVDRALARQLPTILGYLSRKTEPTNHDLNAPRSAMETR
jgi:short-subunit dehydrogenase